MELSDLNLNGDLKISGVDGSVTLTDSNFTASGVSVVLVSSDLTLQVVNLNGGLAVSEISGNVTLTDSNFGLNDELLWLVVD